MTRRTRNMICLWIIFLGLANFVSYTIAYGYIGGDAKNGEIRNGQYFVRGHFIHFRQNPNGNETQVSRGVWMYSYLHSITIPPTVAAIIVCTLLLARPHIIATMREGVISGQTVITVFITVVILIVGAMTVWFILDFITNLTSAG